MHTPQTLAELANEDLRDMLDDLARQLYGHDRWKTQLAKDTGYTPQAVNGWYRVNGRPPALVILWLRATIDLHQMADGLKALRQAQNTALLY